MYKRQVHPGVSTQLIVGKSPVGWFGRLHPKIEKQFKLKQPVFLGELNWAPLASLSLSPSQFRKFKSWSPFPPIERDFALLVKPEVSADSIRKVADKIGKPLVKVVRVFDTYSGPQVGEGMTSIAVRVIFLRDDRSLEESEAETLSTKIVEGWKSELGAELRS